MERVIFKKGKQKEFLDVAREDTSLKKFILKHNLPVNYSTFKKYYTENNSLPLELFEKICRIRKINPRKFEVSIKPANWGAILGGKKGIKTLYKKHEANLKKWRSLGGTNSGGGNRVLKKINLPEKENEKLAELIGAYLGDGTLTPYFIRISGDSRYDLPYFRYLTELVSTLFKINSRLRMVKGTNQLYLEIRSKLLCDYLKGLGIKTGDKIRNQTKIPPIFLANKNLFFACLRGLVDTDGSISKDGKSFSIRFYSEDSALLNQIKTMNTSLKFFTFSNEREVGTRNKTRVINYFETVGSSNLRHIARFCEFIKGNIIRKHEVLNYYHLYKDIKIPYKINGPMV